jgi:hypothetical protein
MSDTPSPVTHYEPGRCYDGYTLFATLQDRDFFLIDMDGRLVHRWPTDETHQAELLPNGNLIYGDNYKGVKEITWTGKKVWSYFCDWHHDLDLAPHGRVMILQGGRHRVFDRPDIWDGCRVGLSFLANNFIEIEPHTLRRTWQWWAHEHVHELKAIGIPFPRKIDEYSKDRNGDIFHCNTLEVLPDTALGRRDPRFRQGNVMFSYRQLSTIGIVDRHSGEIVWAWGPGELDGQHQPTLIPDVDPLTGLPMPGAGHILVFDNGKYTRDYSRVIEVDPVTNSIVWSSPTNWYSWHVSGAQRLPNGNTLICDGPEGRLFEITHAGETVWEYYNPYFRGSDPYAAKKADAAHDDTGGQDKVRSVYRATRYPPDFVERMLALNAVGSQSAGAT